LSSISNNWAVDAVSKKKKKKKKKKKNKTKQNLKILKKQKNLKI